MRSWTIAVLFFALTFVTAHAQGASDPTESPAGDPTGAIRSMKPASGDKAGRTDTDVPQLGPAHGAARGEAGPIGAPAGTSSGAGTR